MLAINIKNISKTFTIALNAEGVPSVTAWRILLKIAGLNLKKISQDQVQRTIQIASPALQNVNLEIKKGSVVCLTGPSGSGKSVLLKILANAIPPSTGCIEYYDTVNSLLNIGDNLDARLTALENIHHYQKMMRLPSSDNESYTKEVIAFAELEEFEQLPVRTYSTGMRLRLSIALALHGAASIYLIDDILGVGDIAFQEKCIERLCQLKAAGRTLIVAFSDEKLIQRLATRIIHLTDGRIVYDGNTLFRSSSLSLQHTTNLDYQIASFLPENDMLVFKLIAVEKCLVSEKPYLKLFLTFDTKKTPLLCKPLIDVIQGNLVLFRSIPPQGTTILTSSSFTFEIEVPVYLLNTGTYKIMCGILITWNNSVYILKAFDAVTFHLHSTRENLSSGTSIMSFPMDWKTACIMEANA